MKVDPALMASAAEEAGELLKALANRHRLMILCQLVDGERSVGDLAGRVGVRDSTVSQHLQLLRKDGLVRARREGQTIWYSIASEQARVLVATLYSIFCSTTTASRPKHGKTKAPRGRHRIEADQ